MKGYWNNGGNIGKNIICGLFKSASQEYSMFATSNSYFRIKPKYNGTGFDAINFENPNIDWQGSGFCFDWVPGAYNVGTSIIVGETCKYNTPQGIYPVDPLAVANFTDVVPAFYVRVLGNGWNGETLPDMNKLQFGGTWKKNKCYASMGSKGLKAGTKPLDAQGNILYNDSTPSIKAVITEESPILEPDPAKRSKHVSAVWSISPVDELRGQNLYSGYNLPLLEILDEGTETTTVSKWAIVQPGAPTQGGAITIGWRLILIPYWLLTYYSRKLGVNYPYL